LQLSAVVVVVTVITNALEVKRKCVMGHRHTQSLWKEQDHYFTITVLSRRRMKTMRYHHHVARYASATWRISSVNWNITQPVT
jgi:hypothetical protein